MSIPDTSSTELGLAEIKGVARRRG